MGVSMCCESCMYRVCSVSVSSNCVSGVNNVELWLKVCCEWGVVVVYGVVGVIGEHQSDGMSADATHLVCV